MTNDIEMPEAIGEPCKVETVQEACPSCGVVQEMAVYEQKYDGKPDSISTDKDCPVCDHHIVMPW